jgi:amino acid permease
MALPWAQERCSCPFSWAPQAPLSCLSPPWWPPLTYWPHKALAQFILSSKTKGNEGITGAVNHYYGKKIGNLITTLYFIAFFVVVLIYAVAITNSLTEQLAKRMTVDLSVRVLVSLGVVLA